MALLEIIHLTGDVERRDLYKRQPMTIGSHPTNDLRIDEEGVEIMHCRISWNKNAWEAVAAGTSAFELNGTPVQRVTLKSGDTLRFGTVDVRFHGGVTVEDTPTDTIGIKPTSDEAILATRDLVMPKASEPKKEGPEKPKTPKSDEQLMQGLELLAFDSKNNKGGSKKKATPDDLFEVVEEDEEPPAPSATKAAVKASIRKVEADFEDMEEVAGKVLVASGPGVVERIKKVLNSEDQRPGEVDPLKSPLVLGILGSIVLFVLLGFTFYFIAFRRIAEAEYEQAKALVEAHKYQEGINALNEFIQYFPKHDKTNEAAMLIGLAKIDQKIEDGATKYEEGVKSIREFVSKNSDLPNFELMKSEVATRAGNAALGAAQLAGKVPQSGQPLITISRDARTLFSSYSPKESQPTEKLGLIDKTLRESEMQIRKYLDNSGITKGITQAITDKKPMEALRLRRELIAKYPDFANDSKVRTLLNQAMEAERQLVKSETPNTPALTVDHATSLPAPRTLMFQARSRTDQVSVNEVVWVLAKDCVYGVDTVTGLPIWRRLTGSDPAFFPVEEDSLPSLIYFDSDHQELVRVQRNLGGLVWRQPLGERISGKPLIDEGQIYLTTVAGALLKIDLQTGNITSRLTFSQPVNGPVIIQEADQTDGKPGESHLIVVGDQDVVYTLTKRPLECVAVSYFAQKSQSVRAPLISLGGIYAAFVENNSEDKSTLHLLKREGAKLTLVEAGIGQIAGMVVDEAVIRGRDLFVPSTVERVSAFSVSNSPDEPALTAGPTFQVQGAKGSPIYLTPGPERQFWMSSSALRRLQLTTDAIQADPKVVANGLSSQPNQHQGALLFNARRRLFTDAVTLTQTERDTLDSEWQVMSGAKILAVATFEGDTSALLVVNEGGATFRVTASELAQPGFHTETAILLPINKETVLPLLAGALPDTQIAVVCGDPEPRIWVINRLGQIERQGSLPANPQAPPVPLGKRIVVPIEGKLHVARTGQADAIVQDFQFPSGEAPPVWKQVLSANDKTLIGLTEEGILIQIRLEQNPKPHLAEVAREPLPGPAVGQLVMHQGRFAVACSTGDVFLFDAAQFEPLGRRTMETPTSGAAYVTEAGVLVETGGTELHCLNPDSALSTKWKMALPGTTLSGQPALIDGKLVLAFESGLVCTVNPATGEPVATQQSAGRLDSGPLNLAGTPFLITWDGSLIPLTPPVVK